MVSMRASSESPPIISATAIVERAVGDLVEHDRVERFPRRFDADMAQYELAAVMLQRVAIHEGLRHRLDGEGVVGIADGINLSIGGGERDPEGGGVGLAELRDIVGDLAAAHL
ncbi:MAG: hypothetical protein WA441_04210 [Methyloceanibacter sp.]